MWKNNKKGIMKTLFFSILDDKTDFFTEHLNVIVVNHDAEDEVDKMYNMYDIKHENILK